jgi:hypothetical protein
VRQIKILVLAALLVTVLVQLGACSSGMAGGAPGDAGPATNSDKPGAGGGGDSM